MRRRLGSALLAAASLALACGVAEVSLRLAGYAALYEVYSKPEVFWRYDERLGWSLEPGARGSYVGPRPFPIEFDTTVEINSFGVRGPEFGPRQPGELRVLVLGDSVVAGLEVEQPETFVARLEQELRGRLARPLAVVNAGVRGYGTDQSLLWYRERGVALAPDVVVLVFSTNDFDDNLTLHRPRRPFGKGAFALRSTGALELVGVPVPRYELCSSWVLDVDYAPARRDRALSRAGCFLETRLADRSALFSVVALSVGRLPGALGALRSVTQGEAPLSRVRPGAPDTALRLVGGAPREQAASVVVREAQLAGALIQALARDVRASGARFVLMMTPRNFERLDARALAADRITPRIVALPSGVQPAEIRFRNDSHFNPLGHEIYARGLAPIVEEELRALLRSREPRS